MKVVQARGETSSTSKHEISNKFSTIALLDPHFHCGYGSYADQNQCGSGSNADQNQCGSDPTPTKIIADLDPQKNNFFDFHDPFLGQCRSSWSCRWTMRGSRTLSPVSFPTPFMYSSFRSSVRWFMLLTVWKSMHPRPSPTRPSLRTLHWCVQYKVDFAYFVTDRDAY